MSKTRSKRTRPGAPQPQQPRGQVSNAISRLPPQGLSAVQQYIRCAAGGHASNVGIPDGDPRLQVTRDLRFRYTLKPNVNGVLQFAIASTPYGVVWQRIGGNITSTQWALDPANVTGIATTASTPAAATGTLFESICSSPGLYPQGNYSAYRTVALNARATFTGSTMQNGGSLFSRLVNVVTEREGTITGAGATPSYPRREIWSPPSVSNTATIGPARDSYNVALFPRSREYHPVKPAIVQSPDSYFALGSVGCPLTDTPLAWFEYSGLDATASITIDVSLCIQCLVEPSDTNMVSLATPAVTGDAGLLDRTLSYLSSHSGVRRGVAIVGEKLARGALSLIGAKTGIPFAALMDH